MTAVIHKLNLSLSDDEHVALIGDSGSGKTTLLHLMAGLLTATSGSITINHEKISQFTDRQLADYRRKIGLVFQHYQLLSALTVKDNILFQLKLTQPNIGTKECNRLLIKLTTTLDISDKLSAFPHQLSGGEQQRVGIARALIHSPSIVFADEPTGNLDEARSLDVVSLLTSLCKERQINLVMVTHSQKLASLFPKTLFLSKGQISA